MPDEASPSLSRRTFITAAAWTAPVVVLAVATPSAMASGEYDLGVAFAGALATYLPNNGQLTFQAYPQLVLTSHGPNPVPAGTTVTFTYDKVQFSPLLANPNLQVGGNPGSYNLILISPLAVNATIVLDIDWNHFPATISTGTSTVLATSAADAVPGNNSATFNITVSPVG